MDGRAALSLLGAPGKPSYPQVSSTCATGATRHGCVQLAGRMRARGARPVILGAEWRSVLDGPWGVAADQRG